MSNVLVSIVCATFNHEKHIKKALDGFVMQKTTFAYEIIINDDASTDNTANIIREYEKKYPSIRAVYQKDNQYSKNVSIFTQILYPMARGKYIAVCEGDDYWIDDHKLQKQIDYLETHPNCTFCFTNAEFRHKGELLGNFIPDKCAKQYFKGNESDYNVGELALLDSIPTASFVYRTEEAKKISSIDASCFRGDVCTRLFCTSFGYAHYIDEVTTVYNWQNSGSLTERIKENPNYAISMYTKILNLYSFIDDLNQNEYHEIFQKKKELCEYHILLASNNRKKLREKKYRKIALDQSFKGYLYYLMKVYFAKDR